MRTAAATVILIGLTASAGVHAQGRGRQAQGIPPGHVPPAGQCRVWYDNVPPGRQPAPTNCDRAEQIASRDRAARVIYGDRSTRANDDWRTDAYRTGGSPMGDRIREAIRLRNGNTSSRTNSVASDNGARDD